MNTIVVAGALANKPHNGGEAWVRLSWILGLKKLGFHVFFMEQIAPECCVDAVGVRTGFEACVNRRYFEQVASLFGLTNSAALIYDQGQEIYGASFQDLLAVCRSADALINISGNLALKPLIESFGRRVYIDIDPGFTQFWHSDGNRGARLEGHTDFYTIGENIGQADCPIPTGGLAWRPVRQPVVLEHWPYRRTDCQSVAPSMTDWQSVPRLSFTTVASWRGPFGPISLGGRTLGLKVHEFRKFIRLPALTGDDFEIALKIEPGDRADRNRLLENGWRLANPAIVARGPIEFRDYVLNSAAEFSVAQGIYVDTRCGWFSDRTVRYLAAGKPVLVQDTGAGRHLPAGEGLVVFSTLGEAIAGARSIRDNYELHSAAARKLAETKFDSNVVLGRLTDELGISP